MVIKTSVNRGLVAAKGAFLSHFLEGSCLATLRRVLFGAKTRKGLTGFRGSFLNIR
jgi:hypothetical protein